MSLTLIHRTKFLIKNIFIFAAVFLYRKTMSGHVLRYLKKLIINDCNNYIIDKLSVSPSELMLWTDNENTSDHSIKTWNVASHAREWFHLLNISGRSKHSHPKSIGIVATYPSAIGLYLAIAVVLVQRGHRVTLIYAVNSSHDGQPNTDINNKMVSLEIEAIKKISPSSLNLINVEAYQTSQDINNDFSRVVELQSHIDTQTVLRLGAPSTSEEYKELYSYRFERNNNFALGFSNLLATLQCDLWLVDSGCWAEYGIAYKLLREAGHDNILCPAFRVERNRIVVSRNKTFADLDTEHAWEGVKDAPVTRDGQDRIKKMMVRFEDPEFYKTHGNMIFQRSKRLDRDEIRRDLGLSPNCKVAVLMANCAWDTTLLTEVRHPLFKSHREWLLDSLQYMAQKEDWVVIVRPHPADAIFESPEATAVLVKEVIEKENLKNIIGLSSDTEINTYGLMDLAEFGLVYSSDVGWEMTLRGKPTIAAGRGASFGKGITYDPKSIEDYHRIIDLATADKLTKDRHTRVAQAEKFALMFIEDMQKPFPWLPGILWEDLQNNDMKTMLSSNNCPEFSEAFEILGGGIQDCDGWIGKLQ